MERAQKRPKNVSAPAHWQNTPPPNPHHISDKDKEELAIGPTRYGDWVKKGIAVDF